MTLLCEILLLLFVFSPTKCETGDMAEQQDYFSEFARAFHPDNLYPYLLEAFTDSTDIDLDCYNSLLPLAFPYNKSRPEWAWRMIDATGKIGLNGGLFEGNVVAFGNYEECINIRAEEDDFSLFNYTTVTQPRFQGQYVLTQIVIVEDGDPDQKLMKSGRPRHLDYGSDFGTNSSLQRDFLLALFFGKPQFGVCIPSTCDPKSFELAINILIDGTLGPYAPPGSKLIGFVGDFHSTADSVPFTAGDIVTIIVLAFIGLVALAGTALDLATSIDDPKRRSSMAALVLCFSLYTNGKKLLSTRKTEGSIDCINGIRFFSMAWVVLGHSFYVVTLTPWENPFDVLDAYGDWSMMLITSGTLSVDTFFLMSGFLMSFLTLKELDKRKFINPLFSYLHRYIRLTPAYALIMLVLSTLILHLGSGPLWNLMHMQAQNCQSNWWQNLLYINNFMNPDTPCMGESWYLACDFQLFILGPPIVLFIKKFKRFGIISLALLMTISVTIPGVLTGVKDWPPQLFTTITSPDWFNGFYSKFYTRSTPYVYGLVFGYFYYHNQDFHRTKGKSLPKWLVALGWVLSTFLCLSTVFGMVNYWPINVTCIGNTDCYSTGVAVAWAMFGRLAWSIGVSWIMYACITGYAGAIGSFLSWKLFMPLSRLTYTIYLIHLHVLFYFHFSAKQVMHMDKYLIVYLFFGHMAITVMFAFVASLLFESPFIGLEKLVFGRGTRKRPQRQTENGETNPTFKENEEKEPV